MSNDVLHSCVKLLKFNLVLVNTSAVVQTAIGPS